MGGDGDGAEAVMPGVVTGSVGNGGGGGNSGGGMLTAGEAVLATAGYDHTIKIWNITTALCAKTFQHPDSVRIRRRNKGSIPLIPSSSLLNSDFYFEYLASECPFNHSGSEARSCCG